MHGLCCRNGSRIVQATVYDHECRERHQDSEGERPAAAAEEDGWPEGFAAGAAVVDGPEELQQVLGSAAQQGCLGRLGHLGHLCRDLSDS